MSVTSLLFLKRFGTSSTTTPTTTPTSQKRYRRHLHRKSTNTDTDNTTNSPKFFAKVTWVDSLSQLGTMVPANQINVPEPVRAYDKKLDKNNSSSNINAIEGGQKEDLSATRVFGAPVSDEAPLPQAIRECIVFIRQRGVATEGLFRRSPPSTTLRAAKDSYNRGQQVDLELAGVHVAAVLLKLFFRELPQPVFSASNYEVVRALPSALSPTPEGGEDESARQQMDSVRARYVQEVVLPGLRPAYRRLLCYVCGLLNVVARNEETNLMNAYNLAIVWTPNLARSDNPVADVSMCGAGPAASTVGSVVQIMIQFYASVFAEELKQILKKVGDDPAMEVLAAVDAINKDPEALKDEPVPQADEPVPQADEPEPEDTETPGAEDEHFEEALEDVAEEVLEEPGLTETAAEEALEEPKPAPSKPSGGGKKKKKNKK